MSFFYGAIAAAILELVFSLGLKGASGLAVRLATGVVVTVFLALNGALPLNALNAFTVGLLGAPGLIDIMIINAIVLP